MKLIDEMLPECSNVTLFNKIIKNLHFLEAKSIPQDPVSWQDELQTLQHFVANIQRLKLQLAGNISIINGSWLSRELYDENLLQSATQQITKLQAIEKVLTSGELLSEKTAKWLELYQNPSLIAEGSNIYNKIFSDVALASYVLNPEHKSKHLSGHQKTAVKFFILDLVDSDQYKIFNDYLCEKNQFGKTSVTNLSSELFWKTFQDFCPGLAEIALKLTSLPAHINKKAEFKKLSSDVAVKISFIKHSKT